MKQGSLTIRLSILFALTTIVLLAGIGTYLYRFLETELMKRDHEELIGKVDLFRHQLAAVNSIAQIAAGPNRFRDVIIGHPHLRLALLDESGNILLSSSDWQPSPAALKTPVAVNAIPSNASIIMPTPSTPYHTVAAWGTLGGRKEGEKALIVLAQEAHEADQLLEDYRNALLAAILVGGIAAASLGFLTARNGLRPLRRMTGMASDISASRLDKRLDVEDAPDELKMLAEAFNAMLERLRDSFTRLSDFSSDLAHELRTPVNNLMGQTQVALSRTRNAEEYRAVLESNLEEYERLARMIGDMLFLAKADNAQTPLHAEEINLREELDKVAEFYQVLADEANLHIVREGEGRAVADRILVQRAIGNLLSNAVRHSPPGSEIRASIVAGSHAIELRVSNPGAGIPPDHLERVFDRFYRIDDARENSATLEGASTGAGLGLAIVKSIMRLHGGDAYVESKPESLTTFALRFPSTLQKHN
jgi:two-component system heavy metal sensor histidine kinase CusS